MSIRDIVNKDVFVYVIDCNNLNKDDIPSKIYKCKLNLKYEEYDRSMWGKDISDKHLRGTIKTTSKFSNGADFQVIRISNDAYESTTEYHGMHSEGHLFDNEFEDVLNSPYLKVFEYYVFASKEDAELYIQKLCLDKVFELSNLISKYNSILNKIKSDKTKLIEYNEERGK